MTQIPGMEEVMPIYMDTTTGNPFMAGDSHQMNL
jgi:hypothetical protein